MTAESDIAAYLESKGYGTVGDTIRVNYLPATPDAVIAVFGYAGQAPERMSCGILDKPSVQVRIRGAKNAAGAVRTKIENIYKDLDGLANITLSGTYYQSIIATQSGPSPLGEDENGRMEYVWNFYTSKSR